jgi:alkylation response protein AidB-like acyl-CoA dehydrogenase
MTAALAGIGAAYSWAMTRRVLGRRCDLDFTLTERETAFRDRVRIFVDSEVRPAMARYDAEVRAEPRWKVIPVLEELKAKAKATGLWNLFMPPSSGRTPVDEDFEFEGEQLTNLEYALCAEEMGRVHWSSEVFNSSAPDTGNMEVLERYGTREQKEQWLAPLMQGRMRSAFLMTEPAVASSDATNIETSIRRDGDSYIVNGRKWWSSGAGDPRCKIAIVMGKTDPMADRHRQQSMILVPMDAAGLTIERLLPVYGFDHAPHGHGEVLLDNVRVPANNMLLGEGRGFEIAQGRLGPGRIHHCMRTIGAAEEALRLMAQRLLTRMAFGKRIADQGVWEERIANGRIDLQMTRLLCLQAADMMDRFGNKDAQDQIAMIKVQAPRMALRILDDAIQAYGGAGVSSDFSLAHDWANIRALRLADGPDEVHRRAIARSEFRRYSGPRAIVTPTESA